jgi:signal transduction histidine kinase
VFDFLKRVPLFSGLPETDLKRLCGMVEKVHLPAGAELFAEGSPGDRAYVIREGEIEIHKHSGGQEVLLAVRRSGEVIGEMALLEPVPRIASARAATDSQLLAIRREQLDQLLASSPSAARALLQTVTSRLKTTELMLRQSERMAQLGTLTAGIAHEINNPVAAVLRGAEQLRQAASDLKETQTLLSLGGLSADQVEELRRLDLLAGERAARPLGLDPLESGDREAEVEAWLEAHGLPQVLPCAADLVQLGIESPGLEELAGRFPPDRLPALIEWLSASYQTDSLLNEVLQGARQVALVVRALKTYTYLDQAPVQRVDIHEGLETTLVILRGKLKSGVQVRREFAPDLPRVQAYASELNQVWTNLIDNAADAMEGRGELILRTRQEDRWIVVEVEDNGPGIPEPIQSRIFDPFFTTKPVGKGTGLGLHVSYNIVQKHDGRITVRSHPGRTVFEVRLPLDPPPSNRAASPPPTAPAAADPI